MKERYEAPEMEVMECEEEDVIRTSNGVGGDDNELPPVWLSDEEL